MTLFNDLISELAIIDPPMTNQSFTWSNMQKTPTLARLDRFLFSTEWDREFPLSKVIALPRVTSDHCPILLTVEKATKRRQKHFRFEEAWLNYEGFLSKVPGWWVEGPTKRSVVLTLTAKLRHYRQRIKEWCSTEFYSIRNQENYLMEEIRLIDVAEEQRPLTEERGKRREELRAKLWGVLKDEDSMWRTRAKRHWLRDGDNNTKYFHSIANGRRRINEIGVITDDGCTYHSEEDKKSYFFRYFKNLFSVDASAPLSFGDWSSLFSFNRVSAPMLGRLTEKFGADEIKKAVFQLGSDKAPGPDGFPLRFYQTF